MFDFSKLWDAKYLFGPNPVELSRSDEIFFWISLVFVLAAIVAKALAISNHRDSPKRFLFGRAFSLFITTGLVALSWVGARYENIPWLSARIIALAIFLVSLAWLGFIVRYFIREYRHRQKLWKSEQLKLKYLTKK